MQVYAWILLLGAIGVFLAGVVLCWLGLRGKRVGDEPRCRKCEYNLTGATSQCCSECGATIDDDGVRFGTRRRIALAIIPGILLILLAFAGGGGMGYSKVQGISKYRFYPFTWVLNDASNGNSSAFRELNQRYTVGELSKSRMSTVADEGLRQQAALAVGPLTQDWIDLLESMYLCGELGDSQTEMYFDNARQYRLNVRPQVRAGENIPLYVQFNGRGPSGSSSTVNLTAVKPIQIELHEVTVYFDCWIGGNSVGVSGWCNAISNSSDLDIGQHEVSVVLKEKIFDQMPSNAEREKLRSPRRERQMEFSGSVAVIPADAPDTVEMNTDPALADSVRAAIRIDRPTVVRLTKRDNDTKENRTLKNAIKLMENNHKCFYHKHL